MPTTAWTTSWRRRGKTPMGWRSSSSTAQGDQTARSDLDVGLVLRPQRLPRARAVLSRKRLDYLARGDLDVQIFQALPLYIRRRILQEGRALFVRDEDLLYDVAWRTARASEDLKRIDAGYLEQVARAGS
jgi:predicted nucleotidyltransferase